MKRELLIVCLAFLFIALPLSCKIEEKPDVRFAVLADIQYDDADPRGTRYYRESMAKFEASVDSLEGYALDFLVQLGDLIDQNPDHFDRLLPIFNRLTCPIYHLVGNHDILVSFQKKETIYKLLGVERGYSDFVVKKWRFIRLDGNEISLRAVEPGSWTEREAQERLEALDAAGFAQAQPWNGAISEQQLQWLEQSLQAAADAGERVVVFCHFPVYPPDQHNLWNDVEVISLLERHNHVVAFMNGHNHAGNYAFQNGIHYVTFRGMVETESETAFARVSLYADRIEIRGYGREPDRLLLLD